MPEMKVTTPDNPRQARINAQQERLRVVAARQSPTVKVYAANEDMRRVLRHANGTRFRSELDQPVEWPNDSFTARRIAEGSVRIDGAASGAASGGSAEPDETKNPREHAAAMKPKEPEQKSADPKQPKQPAQVKPNPPPLAS